MGQEISFQNIYFISYQLAIKYLKIKTKIEISLKDNLKRLTYICRIKLVWCNIHSTKKFEIKSTITKSQSSIGTFV